MNKSLVSSMVVGVLVAFSLYFAIETGLSLKPLIFATVGALAGAWIWLIYQVANS